MTPEDISIHRSLAGPDISLDYSHSKKSNFNPQVPCGTRLHIPKNRECQHAFQSTGPLRDPTTTFFRRRRDCYISIHRSLAGPDTSFGDTLSPISNFNPQVPCGTRPADNSSLLSSTTISIHRSLAGPDLANLFAWPVSAEFQSTGPLRDPTFLQAFGLLADRISIHRSLAGPDIGGMRDGSAGGNFNPQVPCGTRL